MTSLKEMSACINIALVLSSIIRCIRTNCGIQYRVTDLNSVTTENDARQLLCSLAEIQQNTHEV